MYYHSGGMTNDPLGKNLADSVGLWCACFDFYRFGALTDNIKALLLLLIASSCPIAKESGKQQKGIGCSRSGFLFCSFIGRCKA